MRTRLSILLAAVITFGMLGLLVFNFITPPPTAELQNISSPTATSLPKVAMKDQTATATKIPSTATSSPATTTARPQKAPTVFTKTPTLTPTPSPTPETPWGILFTAYSCAKFTTCANDTAAREQTSEHYFVLTDGNQLTSLQEIAGMPDDVLHLWLLSFSQDQKRLAYMPTSAAVDGQVIIADVDNPSSKQFITPPSDFEYFEIMPTDTNCVVFFIEEVNEHKVTLEKRCVDGSVEVIDTAQFTDMERIGRFVYQLAPQGDNFFAYGRDRDDSVHLYVKPRGDSAPSNLIFHSPTPCDNGRYIYAADAYWHSDGQVIEFSTTGECDNQIVNSFYTIEANGNNLTTRFTLTSETEEEYKTSIRFGDWTPDGKQFVYTSPEGIDSPSSGLYVLNLETGTIQQIVSEFYITRITTWQPALASER